MQNFDAQGAPGAGIARSFPTLLDGVHPEGFIACEIERRPRGASRVFALTLSAPMKSSAARAALRGTSPLPHLLQR
ncbi:hypothetical protein, partial [Pseudomonas plecoglossicida]|uniref:hypothetical protein n=1 Tax=Pseudomonas plecoglossicida TaxID=70775 RepID=UPI0019D435E2